MKPVPKAISSSLGKKYLMAVTGLLLIGFLLGHLAGNLLVFAGPDALNTYAHALKANPALLWTARTGLLVLFVVHLYLGISLTAENARARPDRYQYERTLQASWASRHMFLTGMVIFFFLAYHLAHYTFGVTHPAEFQATKAGRDYTFDKKINYLELAEVKPEGGKKYAPARRPHSEIDEKAEKVETRHDVYSMVVNGFKTPYISAIYLAAMVFVWLHLWHGGSSFLQTLGLNGPGLRPFVRWLGPVLSVLIVAGNCAIVLYVWLAHP